MPIQSNAISADGRVVAATQGEMVLWDAENGWQSKGHSFGAGGVTVPHALSADGSVVVGTGVGSLNRTEAVRWDALNGFRPLGFLPGTDWSYGFATSADGSTIVGRAELRDPRNPTNLQTFVWNAESGMSPIPGLRPGENALEASAIAADGSAIYGYAMGESGSAEAIRWTAERGTESLGRLAVGDHPRPQGISADCRTVVGTFISPNGMTRNAFIWDPDNGMRLLSGYLASLGLDLSGWDLWSATGISSDGLTIVGFGFGPSGTPESFIAVIPEPTTACLLGLGLLLLDRRRPSREL